MAERAAPGWVYVLTHPAWDKLGMVKIGKTGRDPGTRAAEITAVSGLLAPCTVAWCAPVADIATAEMAVHRMLAGQRVRKRRESCSAWTWSRHGGWWRPSPAPRDHRWRVLFGGPEASVVGALPALGGNAGAFRRLSASWLGWWQPAHC